MGMLGSSEDIKVAPRKNDEALQSMNMLAENSKQPQANAINLLKQREKSIEEREEVKAQKYTESYEAQKRMRRLRDSQKKTRQAILNVVLEIDQKRRLEKMARKYDVPQNKLCAQAVSYFLDLLEESNDTTE